MADAEWAETFGLWIFVDPERPLCMTIDEFSEFRQSVLTAQEQAVFLSASTFAGVHLDEAIAKKLELAVQNLRETDPISYDQLRNRLFRNEDAKRYYKAFLDFTCARLPSLNLARVTWPQEGLLLVDRSQREAATKFDSDSGYLIFDPQVSELNGTLTRYTLRIGFHAFVRVMDSEILFPRPNT
jgi:hypothetical protein